MQRETLIEKFHIYYGTEHDHVDQEDSQVYTFFAPGRVNIIGEHQDYNGGHVFPAALKMGIYGAFRKRNDRRVRLYSANMDQEVEILLDEPMSYSGDYKWANYSIGMIDFLQREGNTLPGLDIYYEGDLPPGAGLSSSAAILDLTGYMLRSLFGQPIDRTKLAQDAQQVEYHFVGVKVGIMDQFAISQGKENCGVLLNCTTMDYDIIPLTWGDYELIIMDTNKKRDLVNSDFNKRKEECEAALKAINLHKDLSGLSLATVEDLEYIDVPVLKKRARHASTENRRVLAFVEALEEQDIPRIGALINESHASLRDDYEVSCHELNRIVEIARAQEGCMAARMTGAGFGGCAIALVRSDCADAFMAQVGLAYASEIGYAPTLYKVTIGNGVQRI